MTDHLATESPFRVYARFRPPEADAVELPLTLTDTTVLFKLPTMADIERAHERAVSHSWEWYALRSMIGQEVSHVDRGAGVVLEVTQDERIAIRFYKKGKDASSVGCHGSPLRPYHRRDIKIAEQTFSTFARRHYNRV